MMGLPNYNLDHRNELRKYWWKLLAARCPVNVSDAVVIYLLGPDDLDRECAISEGFSSSRLFAVDMDGSNVKRARQHGQCAIQCMVEDLLWVIKGEVHVLSLDTCGVAMSDSNMRLLIGMKAAASNAGCAVFLNMQCGREARWAQMPKGIHRSSTIIEIDIRAEILQNYAFHNFCSLAEAAECLSRKGEIERQVRERLYHLNFINGSYRSSKVRMDWTVFSLPGLPAGTIWHGEADPRFVRKQHSDARRKWIAAKAVMTSKSRKSQETSL